MSKLGAAIRSRLSLHRFLVAGLLVAAFLALVALLESPDPGAPEDNAADLVPASALVYVHASVDTDSDQWRNGVRLLERFPRLVRERNRFLRGLTRGGGALDVEREVEPWLADEAAFALLPDRRGSARSLILLEVSDRDLADSFLDRAAGEERVARYRGTSVRSYGRLATAYVGGFLAIGRPENVHAAIDAASGRASPLARDVTFRRARRGLPDRERLLFAYATRAGVRRVLGAQPGLRGRLARLLDDPALVGVAGVVRAERNGARAQLASVLDRGRRARSGPSRRPFKPRLTDVVPKDAIAYAGTRGADQALEAVATFAGRALPLTPELRAVRSDLQRAGGLRALRQLEPLLDAEAALFVTTAGGAPVVTLVVDRLDARDTDRLLARLAPLLTRLAGRAPEAGRVPTLEPVRVAGVEAVTLRIGPALELTYAIFGGRAVVSTSPAGIRTVKLKRSRLVDNDLFAPGMRVDLERVSSVLFLDLEQLLALGEQAGLGDSPGYGEIRSELGPVRAVTAIARPSGAIRKTEIFIEVP